MPSLQKAASRALGDGRVWDMLKKGIISSIAVFILVTTLIFSRTLHACGHDGFYVGAGYYQLFMYTTEDRLSVGELGRVNFGPGFGGTALIGYDFCGSRWGIKLPFEYARLRLNRSEWINSFGSSLEGVLHLVQWRSGPEIHLVGGFGLNYLTEGKYQDRTASVGVTAGLGPGFSYYIPNLQKVSVAITLEVPVRMVHYFGDRLSASGTTALAVPIRLAAEVGF